MTNRERALRILHLRSVDRRLMSGSKFELVRYYKEKIKEIKI